MPFDHIFIPLNDADALCTAAAIVRATKHGTIHCVKKNDPCVIDEHEKSFPVAIIRLGITVQVALELPQWSIVSATKKISPEDFEKLRAKNIFWIQERTSFSNILDGLKPNTHTLSKAEKFLLATHNYAMRKFMTQGLSSTGYFATPITFDNLENTMSDISVAIVAALSHDNGILQTTLDGITYLFTTRTIRGDWKNHLTSNGCVVFHIRSAKNNSSIVTPSPIQSEKILQLLTHWGIQYATSGKNIILSCSPKDIVKQSGVQRASLGKFSISPGKWKGVTSRILSKFMREKPFWISFIISKGIQIPSSLWKQTFGSDMPSTRAEQQRAVGSYTPMPAFVPVPMSASVPPFVPAPMSASVPPFVPAHMPTPIHVSMPTFESVPSAGYPPTTPGYFHTAGESSPDDSETFMFNSHTHTSF